MPFLFDCWLRCNLVCHTLLRRRTVKSDVPRVFLLPGSRKTTEEEIVSIEQILLAVSR